MPPADLAPASPSADDHLDQPSSAGDLQTANALLQAMPLTRALGLWAAQASSTQVVLVLPDGQLGHNHLGGPHAGASYTLAETASGTLVTLAFADRLTSVEPLAVHAEVDYLRFATGELRATATFPGPVDDARALLDDARALLDAGRRPELDVAVAVTGRDGTVTATMTVRWTLRRTRPAAPQAEVSYAARSAARVDTDRAARYVKQLVSHLGTKLTTTVREDGVGVIDFPSGRCLLTPAADHLQAHAEGSDPAALAVVQDVVAAHLARFAAKDGLVLDWVAW